MIAKLSSGLCSLVLFHTAANAVCDGTNLNPAQLNSFAGETVSFNCQKDCAPWMEATLVDWHETHVGGGSLVEVGTGTTGLQPTAPVGTWDVVASAQQICYQYTGDGTYCYSVYGPTPVASGLSYEFCDGPGLGGLKAIGTVD